MRKLVAISLTVWAAAGQAAPAWPGKLTPTTPALPIGQGPRAATCDPGYTLNGKTCTKQVVESALPACEGDFKFDHETKRCVKWLGKVPACPQGFTFTDKSECSRIHHVSADEACPEGTLLVANGCLRQTPLPSKLSCPASTDRKGDNCVKTEEVLPKYVCPDGFTFKAPDLCLYEETYDCTPVTQNTLLPVVDHSVKPNPTLISTPLVPTNTISTLNHPHANQLPVNTLPLPPLKTPTLSPVPHEVRITKWEEIKPFPELKTFARRFLPTVQTKELQVEFPSKLRHLEPSKETRPVITEKGKQETTQVVSQICKRLKVEAARKICTNGSWSSGGTGLGCITEKFLPLIETPGGFLESLDLPKFKCKPGFELETIGATKSALTTGGTAWCTKKETVPKAYICANGTEDWGDKCVIWKAPKAVCRNGFNLIGEQCFQTLTKAPTVQFTVTFQCEGKECGSEVTTESKLKASHTH